MSRCLVVNVGRFRIVVLFRRWDRRLLYFMIYCLISPIPQTATHDRLLQSPKLRSDSWTPTVCNSEVPLVDQFTSQQNSSQSQLVGMEPEHVGVVANRYAGQWTYDAYWSLVQIYQIPIAPVTSISSSGLRPVQNSMVRASRRDVGSCCTYRKRNVPYALTLIYESSDFAHKTSAVKRHRNHTLTHLSCLIILCFATGNLSV